LCFSFAREDNFTLINVHSNISMGRFDFGKNENIVNDIFLNVKNCLVLNYFGCGKRLNVSS
jgi:hypothetical protein